MVLQVNESLTCDLVTLTKPGLELPNKRLWSLWFFFFLTSSMGHSMEKESQNCSAQGFDISLYIRNAVSYRPVKRAHSLGVILRPLSRAWISLPGNIIEVVNARENLWLKLYSNHLLIFFYTFFFHPYNKGDFYLDIYIYIDHYCTSYKM